MAHGRRHHRGRAGGGAGLNSNSNGTNSNPFQADSKSARATDHAPHSSDGNARRRGHRNSDSHNAQPSSSTPHGKPNDAAPPSSNVSQPAAVDMSDYNRRLTIIRANRPQQRDQFIKEKRMNPDGPMRLEDAVKLVGICEDMCPEYERVRRIVENDVKAPEFTQETMYLKNRERSKRVPDESRMVKAYARSAAGMDIELVSEIRSPGACLRTVAYLMKRLDTDPFDFLQGWIWDRLRAVRKDLITQSPTVPKDIAIFTTCLEQSLRFSITSLHKMALNPPAEYSRQQDVEQLNGTWSFLSVRYSDSMSANIKTPNRMEFFSYDFVLNRQTPKKLSEVIKHYQSQPSRQNGYSKVAVDIACALSAIVEEKPRGFTEAQQNWAKFWAMIRSDKVPYVMACAAETHFADVRHAILKTFWRVYRQSDATRQIPLQEWTLDKLKDVFAFDDVKQTRDFCEAYGFTVATNDQGAEFIDLTTIPSSTGPLRRPDVIEPQTFSRTLVESKLTGRSLSKVILEPEPEPDVEGDSWFVPEGTTTRTAGYTMSTDLPRSGATDPTPKVNRVSPLRATAAPFQPTSPVVTPNPFQAAANSTPSGLSFQKATPTPVSPGLFDASKQSIQFASPSSSNGGFLSKLHSSPTTGQPVAAPPPAFGGFALSAQNAISDTSQKPPLQSQNSTNASRSSISTLNVSSSAPQFLAGPSPEEEQRRQAEDRQKEEANRKALEDEQRAQLMKQRAREETARAAQAAAQKRAQEEENARQRQIEDEQERRERAEQAQRQEEARQAQMERERRAREAEIEIGYESLSNQVFLEENGLLDQFLENLTGNMFKASVRQLQEEKMEEIAEERYQARRLNLMRAACVKWVQVVQKKKKDRELREWRKRSRGSRARLWASWGNGPVDASTSNDSMPGDNSSIGFNNGCTESSASTTNQPEELSKGSEKRPVPVGNDKNGSAQPAESVKPNTSPAADITDGMAEAAATSLPVDQSMSSSSTTGYQSLLSIGPAAAGYSESYQNSTAPSDRTQTDWFDLRAKGLDPSKYRKRSFSSYSDDDEQIQDTDRKRTRRSTSSSMRTSNPEDEAKMARFRAVQHQFRPSAPLPPYSGHISNEEALLRIARAKEVFAKPIQPTLGTQHGFSQSVPSFGHSQASSRPPSQDRPEYWGRTSMFVPPHLYGKGPEVTIAYRKQYMHGPAGGSTCTSPVAAAADSLNLSSPMPTQQSYVPQVPSPIPSQQSCVAQLSSQIPTQQSFIPQQQQTLAPQPDLHNYFQMEDVADFESKNGHFSPVQNVLETGYVEENDMSEGMLGEDDGDEELSDVELVEDDADEDFEDAEMEFPGDDSVQYGQQEYYDEDLDSDMESVESTKDAQVPTGPGATQEDAIELSD